MAYTPTGGIVKLSKNGRLAWGEVSRDVKVITTKTGGFFVKFGLMAGLKEGTEEKQFVDCVAFGRGLASYCKDLQKGDPLCCIGNLEPREYNGNTYWDLKLAWANSPLVVPDTGAAIPAMDNGGEISGANGPQFSEVEDDEGELPFD